MCREDFTSISRLFTNSVKIQITAFLLLQHIGVGIPKVNLRKRRPNVQVILDGGD